MTVRVMTRRKTLLVSGVTALHCLTSHHDTRLHLPPGESLGPVLGDGKARLESLLSSVAPDPSSEPSPPQHRQPALTISKHHSLSSAVILVNHRAATVIPETQNH